MEYKYFITIATVLIVAPFITGESFAVEQKYIDLMNSYVENVSEQILNTEGIAISNYVDYINQTISR